MTESTARAERFDPHSAVAPAFVWEVPQKPVAVHVSLDMVDRLEREVVESFRSVASRGSEIGGLLLGRTAPGSPAIVTIEDYELVPCEYSRGPLYRLSGNDKEAFDAAIRRRDAAPAASPSVVGYFRSNTRKGLSLDAEDILFFSERFNRPDRVVLLVRPFATKTSVAGLFFWEGGQIRSDASYLEFPFARHQLLRLDPTHAPVAAEPSGSLPLAGAIPAAPKPAARAHVVPIASRREIALPFPPAAAQHEETEAPRAAEPAPPPAAAAPEAAVALPEPPPPAAPAPPPADFAGPLEAPMAPPPAPRQEASPVPAEVTPPSFGVALEESPRESRFLSVKTILILSGAAVVVLLVTLLVYPGLLVRRGPAPAPAADSSTIALRVERQAGQLLLTWNREAKAIKTAARAVLSISDGPQRENVEIDLAQLRNGSVAYSPVTSDVSFRLEVIGPDNRPQSEYVRVLGTKPSPMPPPGSEAAAPGQPDVPADAAAVAAGDPAQAGEPSEQASSPASGTSTAEPLADRLKPVRPAASGGSVLEPPSLEHAAAHPAAGLPAAFSAGTPPPPPLAAPAPAPMAAAPPAPAPAPARTGGVVREGRVISRKDPVYPPLAKQARVRGVVELEATVGKDGKVLDVRVLNGHPLLRQAAVDSVKQWLYTPTLLNGVPVESKTRVQVGFNLGN